MTTRIYDDLKFSPESEGNLSSPDKILLVDKDKKVIFF